MAHITGTDRAQVLLLPDTVDDYVDPDNPVRFIDAFVDSLDLAGAGFERAEPKETGRPGYDPADLLKLYIYGYLNRVRSSRRLEAETHRNLEVIWLLRRLRPNFKTIADFRRENREAFRQVFRDFVKVCRSLELFGRELIAVDGTRIKAVNNREIGGGEPGMDASRWMSGRDCEALKPLYISRVRDTRLMHYANRRACRGCALKVQCTSNSYRSIGRYADEAVLDRMAERLADRPGVLRRRRESAEHPFGSIKHWMGHGGFLMRRLENVRGEFSLTALAYNIRRATTLVGIPELIAAVRP